jgi:hypothetical protein
MGASAPIFVGSILFRQYDIDFQHFVVALLFQRNADVVGVDLDVLGDDGNQFALQVGQEVGAAAAAIALMGDDQLQAFLGEVGSFRLVAEDQGKQ